MAGNRKRFEQAMAYANRQMQAENWAEAVRGFRFALSEFPDDRTAIIGFGRASLNAGQVKLAQKAFAQALKLDPGDLEALEYLGETQEQLGQFDAAAETYLRIGNMLADRNELDRAIDAWRHTIGLSPAHLYAHQKLAEGLAKQGRTQEAIYEYLTLAAFYQRQDNEAESKKQLEKAYLLVGSDDPVIAAALDALQQGNPIEPEELVETAIRAETVVAPNLEEYAGFAETFFEEELLADDEDPFGVWDEIVQEEEGKGLLESAQQNALSELANIIFDESLADQAGDLSKDQVGTLIIQAMDYQRRKELQQAVDNYLQVVQGGMATPAVYFNLGLLLIDLGRHNEAIEMLEAAIGARQYRTAAHFALGRAFYATNQTEAALRHFIEAVKLIDLETVDTYTASKLVQYYSTFAEELLALDDKNKINDFIASLNKFFSRPDWERRVHEARQRMRAVAENGNIMTLAEFLETPETEVVITALAKTGDYIRQDLLLTASEECLRAIEKVPSSLLLHIRLGDILLRQDQSEAAIEKYLMVAKVYKIRHQVDKAIGMFKKVLRLAPMDVTVRMKLIDLYIANHNLEEALEQYIILANSYYQLAQVDKSLEKYQEALRLAADSENVAYWKSEILRYIGDIYKQRFDWAGATAAFEELLTVNPDDEGVQRQLVDLYFKQRQNGKAIKTLDVLLKQYQRRQEYASALDFLRELTASYPDEVALRKRLAEMYVQNGMKEQAIAEYDALGEMQLERGQRHEAIATIETILKLGPEDPEGYRRLLSQIRGGSG